MIDDSRGNPDPAPQYLPAARIPVRTISLTIVMALVLYVAMAMLADLKAFGQALSSLPGLLWAEVISLSLISYLARFARWHRFIDALGHPIPLGRSLEVYLAGFALTLTPGKAGETVRSFYLRPYGVTYAESIGAFIAERLLDLVAVGLLASLTIFMFPEHRPWAGMAIACGILTLIMLRSRLMAIIATRLAKGSLGRQASRGMTSVRFLLSGTRLAKALPLSFLAWAAQGFSLYLIVDALGYDLSSITVIAIYCLSILAGAASFIPGGLGATEAAIALLLGAAGVTQGDAITASLLGRGLTLWLALSIGIGAMSKIAVVENPQSRVPAHSK